MVMFSGCGNYRQHAGNITIYPPPELNLLRTWLSMTRLACFMEAHSANKKADLQFEISLLTAFPSPRFLGEVAGGGDAIRPRSLLARNPGTRPGNRPLPAPTNCGAPVTQALTLNPTTSQAISLPCPDKPELDRHTGILRNNSGVSFGKTPRGCP
jgi:hypothetical protein